MYTTNNHRTARTGAAGLAIGLVLLALSSCPNIFTVLGRSGSGGSGGGGGGGGGSVNGGTPVILVTPATLAAYLANNSGNPLRVVFDSVDLTSDWGTVNSLIAAAGKNVILDLTNCTFSGNTITGTSSTPSGNTFNIIKDNTFIKSIVLPSSLTSIGSSAFYGCTNLTSITIPASVTTIGTLAFQNCTNLTSVTILTGVQSIGRSAFEGCTSLTSITIPASVTTIGTLAFQSCTPMTSVTFAVGSNITNFETQAFPQNGGGGGGGDDVKTLYQAQTLPLSAAVTFYKRDMLSNISNTGTWVNS